MRDRLYVRASAEDLERWRGAAEKAGAPSLSELTRQLLERETAKVARSTVVAPSPEPETDWRDVLARIAAGLPPT
jgi:hypothetical protein